jgi:outer membrane protein assembly factor BamE (lipoprotein component of BamABCDE complex)
MRALAILALAAALAGCGTSGVRVTPEQVASIQRGVSTEADVRAALGAPTGVSTVNGQRILVYSSASYQVRPESFIPVVGAFVGGADVRSSYVAITIAADGRVADLVTHHHETGATSGLAVPPAAPVANQPR